MSSVLGGLLALSLARRIKPMRLGVLGFAAMAAPIWLLSVATPLPLVLAAMFVFGIGGPLGVSPISAMLTTRAPVDIRPQVVSAFPAITSAGTPLGAAGAGWLIAWLGFGPTYACIASSLALATILLLLFVRRTRVVAEAIPAAAA